MSRGVTASRGSRGGPTYRGGQIPRIKLFPVPRREFATAYSDGKVDQGERRRGPTNSAVQQETRAASGKAAA